jgi:hypothetical protein
LHTTNRQALVNCLALSLGLICVVVSHEEDVSEKEEK